MSEDDGETVFKPVLKWKLLKSEDETESYYATNYTEDLDEMTNSIVYLGGMNYHDAGKPLDHIETMSLSDFEMSGFHTLPNEEDSEYPKPRDFHASCRYGRNIIIAGGCDATKRWLFGVYLDDIWSLNLDTKQWTKLPFKLTHIRIGHRINVTKDGRLLVFGGAKCMPSKYPAEKLEIFVLEMPKLATLALDQLRSSRPWVFEGIDGSNLTCNGSDLGEIYNRAVDPVYLKEQRNEAAENFKHLPMVKSTNGWEYDDGHLWLIRRKAKIGCNYSLRLFERGIVPEEDEASKTTPIWNYDEEGHILRKRNIPLSGFNI